MESIAPPAASQRRIAMVEVNMWPSMTAAERYSVAVQSSTPDRSRAGSVVEQNVRHDWPELAKKGRAPPAGRGDDAPSRHILAAGLAVGS